MTKQQIKEAVAKAIASGNPYIKKSVQFFIDHTPMYLYAGQMMTKEQLDTEYAKTAEHDIQMGYKDRMVGYYDKWYRYSHADEGRAYDLGVRIATASPKCPEEFNIIGCMA